MKLPFINRKKLINKINTMMWEEQQDSQFEESQVMRSYSAGIIDGLGYAIALMSDEPAKEAWAYPISISFYEEDDESCTIAAKHQKVEDMRERVFDLQQSNKLSLFYEEAD